MTITIPTIKVNCNEKLSNLSTTTETINASENHPVGVFSGENPHFCAENNLQNEKLSNLSTETYVVKDDDVADVDDLQRSISLNDGTVS